MRSSSRKADPVQPTPRGLCAAAGLARTFNQQLSASTLALLALLSFGSLASFDAHALALGRLNVLSSIGEPLRAEVEILDLTAADADSLRPSLASAEAYKAMGLDYNPDLNNIQFNVLPMADGRTVLQLNNSRPVTAAFVDIVLEVSWASGKITRDYTLLLTPPKSAVSAQPVAPVLPMAAQRITVVRGDTLGQLAMQNLPVNVSLDQMLLALLRSNPEAFVAGNVNRLKAGAVLKLPSAADANTVARAEARQTIIAQSRDFNAFRQRLALNARPAQVAASGRETTGKVDSSVTEKTPAATAADKLTLSKGALTGALTDASTGAGTANAEEELAQQRQAKDAAERLAELSKNISDLSQLSAAPATTVTAAAATASQTDSALAVGTPPAVTAAAEPEPPSLIERLSNQPVVLPAATGFLGLLLAWGFLRSRRNSAAKNNAFNAVLDDADRDGKAAAKSEEPALPPAIPATRQEPLEDDPLTIAQNALALGREAQAETLLRGALKRTPQRLALHIELMDMCTERDDAAGFEKLAIDALTITGGQGANWQKICKKGQALDPTNPLYQSAAANPPPVPPFSKFDFDLELGTAAPDKAPPRAKS